MHNPAPSEIHSAVRTRYGEIAARGATGCGGTSCCPGSDAATTARRLGYSGDDLAAVPEGANLGLGCGNPQAVAGLRAGEVVLDLGSGAGFDCLLAARAVGATGRVIGVDMTPEMIARARANAAAAGAANVEFLLGQIEDLPLADASVDVIISNCVIKRCSKAQASRPSASAPATRAAPWWPTGCPARRLPTT